MVFSSLTFICVFLPVVFILYSVIPSVKIQNALLILVSLLFYAYGEPVYVLLMIGSTLINYIFALAIDKGTGFIRKFGLLCDVLLNLLLLGYFKYFNMFIHLINRVSGSGISSRDIALPLGISFFTFQAMSYVIDVYRQKNSAQKNFFKVLLYISFFPQLIAGPIVKYHDIEKCLDQRKRSAECSAKGLRRFCYGLAKKVLISNVMGQAVDSIYAMDGVNALLAWIAAIAYMLQIYYDFSGYSDMAIGMGQMFGFDFPENFNYPYIADSIKEFWRRWHISLSSWFKEYLYIPLGGNRKGKFRTIINKWIVFFCTGLWHGANWTFVLWGLYHGFFSMIEQIIHLPKNKFLQIIKHIYAVLVVCVGFVIFRADTISQAWNMIQMMFSGFYMNTEMNSRILQIMNPEFITMLILGIIGAAPVKNFVEKGAAKNSALQNTVSVLSYVGAGLLLLICMLDLSGNGYNPFIYFRF